MERYITNGWVIIGLILSIIFGPLWVPILMVGMFLIWLYYKPQGDNFKDFWQKWCGLYYLGSVLCLFRFWIFVPIFAFIGVAIDYCAKVMYK